MEQNDARWSDAAPTSASEDERGGVAATHPTTTSPSGAATDAFVTAFLSEDGESAEPVQAPVALKEPHDPVAVVALVLVILLISVPAAVVAAWGVHRARSAGRRGGLARGVLIAAIVEIALGVFLTSLYFAFLAPVLTLPAG